MQVAGANAAPQVRIMSCCYKNTVIERFGNSYMFLVNITPTYSHNPHLHSAKPRGHPPKPHDARTWPQVSSLRFKPWARDGKPIGDKFIGAWLYKVPEARATLTTRVWALGSRATALALNACKSLQATLLETSFPNSYISGCSIGKA